MSLENSEKPGGSRLTGMAQEEIRETLARNLARAFEIHANAEARRAAERAALTSAPRKTAPPRRTLAKPRIGPAMRRIADYVSAVPGESVTSVLVACGISTTRSSNRASIYRAEAAGLILIDRVQSNLYRVFANEADREAWYQRQEQEARATTPGMRELADITSAMPGISKSGALWAADMASDRELNRAIDTGLIIVERVRSNLFRLFANERDKKIWHLRRGLLEPGTPTERVAEIRAEIDRLQTVRAQTWTAGQTQAIDARRSINRSMHWD